MSAKGAISSREQHIKDIKSQIKESDDKEFKDEAEKLIESIEAQIEEINNQPVLKIKPKKEEDLTKAERSNLEKIKERMKN